MHYAGFGRRLVASLMDGAIVGGLARLVTLLAGDSATVDYLISLGTVVYYVLFTGMKGQTPGKLALGVKVQGPRGGPPGVGRAFLREVVGKFLSLIGLGLGYLWILWDDRRQGWHDKIAGTVVLRTGVTAAPRAGATST